MSRNPLTTVPVAPAVSKPSKSSSTEGGALFLFPLPLLWDERSFIKVFRLISLPSGRRRLLPSHRALDTHRVFCPSLKRTLFAEQSQQHVKRRKKKKKVKKGEICDVCWRKNPLICLDKDSQHVQCREQKEMLVLCRVCGKSPVNIMGCFAVEMISSLPSETPNTPKIPAEKSSLRTAPQIWTLSPSLRIQ